MLASTPGNGCVAEPGLSGGLPPCVDHRAAPAADHRPVPDPGLGVDRLADGAEQPQRRQVVLLDVLGAPAHERPDRGRRRVEDRRLVTLGDRPQAVLVRPVGRPLVEDPRRVVRERPVHDVRVAGDPPDIGRAPVHVVLVDVEDHAVRRGDAREVAARRVHDPLGLAGRAARVQQVERVLGVHVLGLARRGLAPDEVVVPDIASLGVRMLRPGSPNRHHVLDRRASRQRGVRVRLQRHLDAATVPAVLRDQGLGAGVVDAVPQRLGREPAEHHGVRRADPGAREHRDRQLGDHAHVDRNTVALAHAERPQAVGQPADLAEQLPVRERSPLAGLALPVIRDLVAAARLDVAVQAVVRGVQRAAHEPLHPRRRPLHHRVPPLEP
jgi:hypothetical protein